MSYNQKYSSREHNSFSVEFPDYPTFGFSADNMTLEQKINTHDVLTLEFTNFNVAMLKGLKTQSPVIVNWRTSNKIRGTFYGVVYAIQRTHAVQSSKEVEIICMGLTFPMKQSRSGVLTNKTISEVVSIVAKRNGLKAVVSGHPVRYSQITQQGESDWEFLQRLAEDSGYTIAIKEKTLLFRTIDEIVSESIGGMPILYQEQTFMPKFSSFEEQTLDKFTPLYGEYLESPDLPNNSFKITRGVDPIKALSFTSTESPKNKQQVRKSKPEPIFNQELTKVVSNTAEVSQSSAKAKAAKARFNLPANFKSQGDPRILPNSLVEVRGIMGDADGYWLVQKVTHYLNVNGVYQCKGTLLSDGKDQNFRQKAQTNSQADAPSVNIQAKLKNQSATKKKPSYKKPTILFTNGKATTSTGKWS
jgi:phage protein D